MSLREYKYFKSAALSEDENLRVRDLLGARRESMATTVVEIYVTRSPKHKTWDKQCEGVLCFVKDHCSRAYYFRLYCLNTGNMLWEHECYKQLQYICDCEFFHMFEAQDCIVSFNFTNIKDAEQFKKMVHWAFKLNSGREKCVRRTLTRNDISSPQNFHHVSSRTMNLFVKMIDVQTAQDDSTKENHHIKAFRPPPLPPAQDENPPILSMKTEKPVNTKLVEENTNVPVPPPIISIAALINEPVTIDKRNMQNITSDETDSRSCLLESIRKGKQLKPTNVCKMNDQCAKTSLGSALSKVIAERERALRNSCSSSSESLHNSDWSDD